MDTFFSGIGKFAQRQVRRNNSVLAVAICVFGIASCSKPELTSPSSTPAASTSSTTTAPVATTQAAATPATVTATSAPVAAATTAPAETTRAPISTTAALAAQSSATEPKLETLVPADFDPVRSTIIDNKWLPMRPGMRYVYVGTTVEDDGKVVPHRLEINITDLVKVIAGIRTVVSYDLDYSDNELVEAELALFAQDKKGNVWHFGQYPEEYDEGKMTNAPAWIHGIQGANAGITMKADPKVGDPSYSQGWGPAVNWTDRGQTHLMDQKTAVKAGKYENVLVVKETAASEGDAYQLKYYAPGVGNVRVGWAGAQEKSKESLELVKIEKLDAKALANVRAKALALEKSAYKVSKQVYALTTPAVVNEIKKNKP